jgi:glycosyltransferase involved in cell wall biosynthesis
MRIVYSFPDTLGAPGIGTTAVNQVRGLIARGHEVHVYCTSAVADLPGVAALTTTLTLLGRRVPHRALGRERAYRYHDRRVARALRKLRPPADVVHVWPRATVQTAAAAREVGTKSVREVPNTHTAYAYESVARETAALGLEGVAGHSHTFDPAALALEEAEFRAVDALAVPSEFSRRTFVERGFDESRLLLHQYGFDPARFGANGRSDEPGDGLTVLFAGRCEPRKGLHHALRAWIDSGAAERGRFVICGDFFPGYRDVLGASLEHPSVEVRGFEPDLAGTMRGSDILMLPSIEEGSALVTYEAQASGCVLLVSDAAGARCEHMEGGLIHAAGDVEALTEHLRLLDADRALLARMRERTLARRPELTWDRAAEDLESIYEHLTGAGR